MKRWLPQVAAGVFAAVLLVTVATSEGAPLAQHAPSLEWTPDRGERTSDAVPTGLADFGEGEFTDSNPGPLDRAFATALRGLLLIALAAGALYAGREAWRGRPRLAWRRPDDVDFDVLTDFASSVAEDAAEQRAALETGRTRNAIVECWARLEALVVESGLAFDPAETAAELTERVLGHYEIDRSAIRSLSALYREARFSSHEMDEADRADAIDALAYVHAGIRSAAGHRGALP